MTRILFLFLPLFVWCSRLPAQDYALWGITDKDVAIYKPGEPMVFTVQVLEDGKAVGGKTLKWTRSGDDGKTESGEEVVGEKGLVVSTKLDQPGFVRLQVWAFDPDGTQLEGFVGGWGANKTGKIFFDGGGCVEPGKITPMEEPEDFDAFWKTMKAKLDGVPLKAERKKIKSPDPKVNLYEVSVACAGAQPVTGFLSVPVGAEPKSLKAVCNFQGYGVRTPTPPGWVHPGAMVFHVNAHGMDLGREEAYYDQLKEDLSGYAFDGEENEDPETAYFHDMALRVLRSLEYLKSLPEWNGKELESNGGSQGGLQAMWGAGQDPDVTSCQSWSPWCCDLGGRDLGRMGGWRPDNSKVLALYDPVYHVRRTRAKIHLTANFGDYTCPPSTVWAVYNEIPHENKSIEVKQGCTHGYMMKPHMSFTMTPEGVRDVGMKEK